MEVTQDQLIQIVASLPAYFDQNSQFQKDAAQFQKDALAFQKEQSRKLDFVIQELAEIKSNVIVIRNVVLSDFAGQTPAMQEQLETTGEAAMDEEEQIIHYAENYQLPEYKETRKLARTQTPARIIQSLEPKISRGERTAFGDWTSRINSLLFGQNLKSQYHPAMAEWNESLALFYTTDRQETGRLR